MRCCDGGSKGDRHLRKVRCACPPLVPFLVTFCGTTKSNCPRGMSANSKKKKSPIPRTKPGHRRMNCGTTKRTVSRLRHERAQTVNFRSLKSENYILSLLAPTPRRTMPFRLCGGQFLFSARKKGTKKRAKGEGGQFTCTQVSAFPLGSPTTPPGLVRGRSQIIPGHS